MRLGTGMYLPFWGALTICLWTIPEHTEGTSFNHIGCLQASHSPKQNGKYSHSAQLCVSSKLFTAQASQQRKLLRKEKKGVGRSRPKAGNSFGFSVAS